MKTFRYSDWVRFPTHWIEDKRLFSFTWKEGAGSDYTAALACLIAIAHRVDEQGIARITYNDLQTATSMSRAKVAAGLGVLEGKDLIQREAAGQSTYFLTGFDPAGGWAKLPAKPLYEKGGAITAFKELHLRKPIELHALKLYLLFVSRRDRAVNLAVINYGTIASYTGLQTSQIRQGITLLSALNLIHVERVKSWESDIGKANAYRLVGLDSYVHRGTTNVEAEVKANYS